MTKNVSELPRVDKLLNERGGKWDDELPETSRQNGNHQNDCGMFLFIIVMRIGIYRDHWVYGKTRLPERNVIYSTICFFVPNLVLKVLTRKSMNWMLANAIASKAAGRDRFKEISKTQSFWLRIIRRDLGFREEQNWKGLVKKKFCNYGQWICQKYREKELCSITTRKETQKILPMEEHHGGARPSV